MKIPDALSGRINLTEGTLEGGTLTSRYLSELNGIFADEAAYGVVLKKGNPLLYTISVVEAGHGDGQLHYALGKLMPGKIGVEYFMTKGHYHAWRPAAEVYIGVSGQGSMLLENSAGETRLLDLEANTIVYVPGETAHRTINTGSAPLLYLGIYPANAGHDYAAIAASNFRNMVIEKHGRPALIARADFHS